MFIRHAGDKIKCRPYYVLHCSHSFAEFSSRTRVNATACVRYRITSHHVSLNPAIRRKPAHWWRLGGKHNTTLHVGCERTDSKSSLRPISLELVVSLHEFTRSSVPTDLHLETMWQFMIYIVFNITIIIILLISV